MSTRTHASPKGNRTARAHERRVLRDTETYKRIRAACCSFAAANIDLDAHALVITREVMHARRRAEDGG